MSQTLNIDLDQTTALVCEECGCIYFQQALVIRKISGILAGTGRPSYYPIPVFACKKCGHVNLEFQPKEEKKLG